MTRADFLLRREAPLHTKTREDWLLAMHDTVRAHETPRALRAREAFLRERALLRKCVSDALAQGFVIDPDQRARADRDLTFALVFRRRHYRTPRLIPVPADFCFRHQKLIDDPHQLWALASAQEHG